MLDWAYGEQERCSIWRLPEEMSGQDSFELIIVANKEDKYACLASRYHGKDIIDLVSTEGDNETSCERCQGFCW